MDDDEKWENVAIVSIYLHVGGRISVDSRSSQVSCVLFTEFNCTVFGDIVYSAVLAYQFPCLNLHWPSNTQTKQKKTKENKKP